MDPEEEEPSARSWVFAVMSGDSVGDRGERLEGAELTAELSPAMAAADASEYILLMSMG